ncbi:MAG: hypothetical protein JNL90_11260 [Planctomycetes bacterium]|nr:hypothetical protein [Planctomycetota bacterium]
MSSGSDAAVEERAADRAAGWLLGAASLLSVAFMAVHPVIHSRGIADALAELSAKALRDRVVHGSLAALTVVLAVGWWRLLERLSLRRVVVRVAAAALLLGALGYVGAALVNGFVLPGLADRYLGRPQEEMAGAVDLLRLCREMNQALAKLGVLAWAAALLLASQQMVASGRARGLGGAGLLVAAVMAVAIGSGLLPLHLWGMAAIVLLQASWNVAAAVALVRGRFAAG